jgi:signal transduction histidine kinase
MAKSLDEIVWTVNPSNDSLLSTINYLCSRTQESLAAAGLRCRLEVGGEISDLAVDSELRHHLLMAVNEAVNNVMKHASASECRLVTRFAEGCFFVTIADDGCGFNPSEVRAERNGLANLRRRMASAGGSCKIDSGTGKGTQVILEVPLTPRRFRLIVPPERGATRTVRSAFE